jgi:hypothetical protein
MAFTGDEFNYKRWDQFHYFTNSVPINSTIIFSETIGFSVLWKLAELRLHLSTAAIATSNPLLKVRLSSINNSSLNTILLSQYLSSIQDYNIYYSNPLLFFSGEDLTITIGSNFSVTNLAGCEVIGWAVRG